MRTSSCASAVSSPHCATLDTRWTGADKPQYAQELLSTFAGTTLGEVALKPATGGVFTVEMSYRAGSRQGADQDADAGRPGGSDQVTRTVLWDRKAEKGSVPTAKVGFYATLTR